jgi:thiamine biosynthesis lipoprotein
MNCKRHFSPLFYLPLIFATSTLLTQEQAFQEHNSQLVSASHQAMGTVFTVYLYAASPKSAAPYLDAAFDEIDRLDATLSNYRSTSELSRINRLAGRSQVTTDPEEFTFLQRAIGYSLKSDGAFDMTVGSLVRAWGFFRGEGRYPDIQELKRARRAMGWQHVVLDAKERTVRFTISGIELDPGGIGKGYAVERVAELLREAGVKAGMIDAGSSTIYGLGAPPDAKGWTVHVPRPGHVGESLSTITLRDQALSTSGSYEKFFRLNGRTYCHIMDPRTGVPVQSMLQTTVITPSATDSDALSTAIFVLGPERGKKLLDSFPQTGGLWVQGKDPSASKTISWHWPGELNSSGERVQEFPQSEHEVTTK